MKIGMFKHLHVPKPVVGGLVLQVTSPKGIRQFREETQRYHYNLHTNWIMTLDDRQDNCKDPIDLGKGLYWLVAICRSKELGLHWNHYIFKVDENGLEELGSYTNQLSSDWIVEALPAIKRYFKR